MKNNKLSILKQEAANENTSLGRLKELAKENNTLAKIVAENAATPAEILRELSNSKSNAVRKAVTGNPNTPTDILFNLGAKFPEQFLSNPVFDLLLLENPNLLEDLPERTFQKLLALPEVPKYFLESALQRQWNYNLVPIIVENPNTPKDILEKLSKSKNFEVKQKAKLHVNYMGEIKEGWEEIALEEVKKIPKSLKDSQINEKIIKLIPFMPYTKESVSKSTKDFLLAFSGLQIDRAFKKLGFLLEIIVNTPNETVRRSVAENNNTPIDILEVLARYPDNIVRANVAKNSNTPISLLRILARSQYRSVKQSLAKNNNTPVDILEVLARDKTRAVRENVAKNNNSSIAVLERLASDRYDEVKSALLENTNTPISGLKILAETEDESIRIRVVNHVNCSSDLLEILAKDKESSVRAAVATNVNCSLSLLKNLAKDRHRFVRAAVANNPNCSIELIEYLAKDKSQDVRAAVASNLNTPISCLENLALDPANIVRIKIISNPNSPRDIVQNIIENLAEYFLEKLDENKAKAKEIYLALVTNTATPENILKSLISRIKYYRYATNRNDKSDYIFRCQLVGNPNTPIEILRAMNTAGVILRHSLADNPSATADILKEIIDKKDPDILVKILLHPQVTYQVKDKIFQELIFLQKDSYVLDKILENPQVTSKVKKTMFYGLIKLDRSHFTRLIVLFSSHADPALLSRNANSSYWFERYAVAQNSNTPEKTLEKLSTDANAIVRAAAKASLNT